MTIHSARWMYYWSFDFKKSFPGIGKKEYKTTMKNPYFKLLLILTIAILVRTAFSQDDFPYHVYDPRTLAEFDEIHSGVKDIETDKTTQIMVSAKPFYSAIRVEYVGRSRAISKERLGLFKIWQEALNINSDVITRLDKEYLFRECDREYWIPVQKQVAAFFPRELKDGDNITLYLMAVGGVKPAEDWELLFLANEFQKY
ncbi:MAG: hypothetical protein KDB79_13580 [Acidobacteria bacterium]|nr:hypothetical protein [Acidobacteriota bacterium]